VLQSLLSLRWASFRFGHHGWQPRFGAQAVAVAYVEDLRVNRPTEDDCRACCGLHGRGVRHGHFLVGVGHGFLGALELFADGNDRDVRRYDFTRAPEAKQEVIASARRAGDMITVHLPTKLLGAAAGLPPGQRRIHQALVGELVRLPRKARSSRADRAALVNGNRVPGVQARTWIDCPGLQPGGRYADFNGNGKRRGRGYRPFGARGTGWLHKAGYPVPDDDRGRAESLRAFLTDLSGLAGRFGLIVCSIDPTSGEWLDLDAMVAVARLPGGWQPLDRVHLRVYAPSDYLERWREQLASGANFADLPRVAGTTAPDPVASPGSAPGWKTGLPALDLALEVQRHNVKQKDLARHLGVSPAFVCQVLKGLKRVPDEMLRKARDFLTARAVIGG
jgi:hypothetical protein